MRSHLFSLTLSLFLLPLSSHPGEVVLVIERQSIIMEIGGNSNIICTSCSKWETLNSVGEDLRRRREQEDKVLLCLERRETINGEKTMALGREVNSDKALCWKKVPSNPYNFSCSTAMKRCTAKLLFCQSWQTTQFFWKRPMVKWVTHTQTKHF